jgi:hypothetical protein
MVPYFCSYLVLSLSSLSNGFWLTSTVKREARRATVALVKVESTDGMFSPGDWFRSVADPYHFSL